MKDITRRLREADPLSSEPGLTPEAIAELRRVAVSAAHDSARAPVPWLRRSFAIAAAVALIVGAGIAVNRRAPAPAVSRPVATPAAAERTQVQFSTPGGTRIVWTIDPSFQIKGTR